MRFSFLPKRILPVLAFLFSFSALQAQLEVKTEVYPGVELLNVIHLLSDSAEIVPSVYAKYVREKFHAFRDHPAVVKARELALINCDFPLRHSWCFYNFPSIKLRLPDTLGAYNRYVTTAALQDYFKACVDFYRESRFWDFFVSYQPEYEKWIRAFNRNLYEDGMLGTIDSFYRTKPSNKVLFTLGAMNCNSFALPEASEINPVFKGNSVIFIAFGNLYRSATDSTQPYFYSAKNSQLIWHEAGHVFLADLFHKYDKEVLAIQDIFDRDEEMKRYAGRLSWPLFLDENITQGVTSYLRIRAGIVSREAEFKRLNDFNRIAKLIIPIIEEQYTGRAAYADFDQFFPVLLLEIAKRMRE